ncbi:MAG: head-tail adaptor protein [Pontixanthobacter sp.]
MGNIRAGNLNRKVEFLRAGASSHDGYQNVPGPHAAIGTAWASLKPAKGTERFADLGREARSVMSLWVRWSTVANSLTADDAVRIDGRIYAIVAPPVEIGRREGWELFLIEDNTIRVLD